MAMVSALTKIGRVAIDMLFPPRCVGCGSFGTFLCQHCAGDLPPAVSPRCPVCWQPYKGTGLCPRCRRERPAFAGLRSPYIFRETVRELVHGLKYNHQSVLALPIASLLSRYLVEVSVPADVLIPVPLYPRRERVRGYNQSALLARELGRHHRAAGRGEDAHPGAQHALSGGERRRRGEEAQRERRLPL